MKKILLSLCLGVIAAAGFTASALTQDELCGKIVGQVFYGNTLHDAKKSVPVFNTYGVFTPVEGTTNKVRLSVFRKALNVEFEIVGDNLKLVPNQTCTLTTGGNVKIVPADQLYAYSYGSYDVTFKELPNVTYLSATTNRWSDGTINIRFGGTKTGYCLQFQRYFSRPNNANANVLNDYIQTYENIDLFIYDSNNTMSYYDKIGQENREIPLYVSQSTSDDITTFKIRNFAGYGFNYYYQNNTPSNFTHMNDGVSMYLDGKTNEVSIPVTAIGGAVQPYCATSGYLSTQYGYLYAYYTQHYYGGGIVLQQTGNTPVSGTFEPLAGEHTDGMWDAKCGGTLNTMVKGDIKLGRWMTYYDADYPYAEIEQEAAETTIPVEIPATHTGELVIDAFKVNHDAANPDNSQKNNVYVKCHLENKVNNRLVENYELCMVPGNFKNINEDHGHNIHNDYGFEKVVNLSKDGYEHHIGTSRAATLNSSEDGSFELAVPASVIKANGWDFDNKENNKFTFFVKANYKEGSAKDGSRLAPTFHALNYRTDQITTGIEAASFDADIRIVAVNGGIEVEGAENVEVYNVGGSQVYQGAAGHIDVAAGLYIVRADGKVAKVNVK